MVGVNERKEELSALKGINLRITGTAPDEISSPHLVNRILAE
jgi:hypothetical protein